MMPRDALKHRHERIVASKKTSVNRVAQNASAEGDSRKKTLVFELLLRLLSMGTLHIDIERRDIDAPSGGRNIKGK